MSKVEELNELFIKWKEEHKNEKLNNEDVTERTIPVKEIDKNSFTYDGFVFDEKDGTILYILSESNVGDNAKEDNDMFWFKGIYKVENNTYHSIPRRIEKMQKVLCQKIPQLTNRDISYMNINKRGGFGECNKQILYNYYKRYKEHYIWKEIEIINPKLIVFCVGAYSEEIYKDIKNNVKCKYMIQMPHPSCRVSDEKYIEEFKEKLNLIIPNS
ncbi:MAG TPA: hypothetical protein OIM45_06410 [Clostridiaceae bacterium]|jgi:hypothetical protein|nr:hypothetical protein [Clostridiaceae bacterium]